MTELIPLGLLGHGQLEVQPDRARRALLALRGGLTDDVADVVAYLRRGIVLAAIMTYSTDLLDGAFRVAGGPGIMTDGRYFWRVDAAEYVAHHRMAVPADFVEHARSLGWRAPVLDEERIVELDEGLYAFASASGHDALWPPDDMS